jgi:hypothetical protein
LVDLFELYDDAQACQFNFLHLWPAMYQIRCVKTWLW